MRAGRASRSEGDPAADSCPATYVWPGPAVVTRRDYDPTGAEGLSDWTKKGR